MKLKKIDAEDLTSDLPNAAPNERGQHWRTELNAANVIG